MLLTAEDFCKRRFLRCWIRLGGSSNDGIEKFKEISRRYNEPHRMYHNFDHIGFCLQQFDQVRTEAEDPEVIELAIIKHDVIYDVDKAPARNEERSAEFALKQLQHVLSADRLRRLDGIIIATKHDKIVTQRDEQLMVDVDLAGLGLPAHEFDRTYSKVREEYEHVPEDVFRKANGEILKRFLEKDPLYYHPYFQKEYGRQAKENLTRWLNRP